jgi:hypothetical protein
MLLDPSSGSKASRYLPRWSLAGSGIGASFSSDTMPASSPPQCVARRKISSASTSSFFCSSPCTLALPWLPSTSASAPWATAREIALHAWATCRMRALSSPVASGLRRRCSIRYSVSVLRSRLNMVCLLRFGAGLRFVVVCRGAATTVLALSWRCGVAR